MFLTKSEQELARVELFFLSQTSGARSRMAAKLMYRRFSVRRPIFLSYERPLLHSDTGKNHSVSPSLLVYSTCPRSGTATPTPRRTTQSRPTSWYFFVPKGGMWSVSRTHSVVAGVEASRPLRAMVLLHSTRRGRAAEVLQRDIRGALVDARDAALEGLAVGSSQLSKDARLASSNWTKNVNDLKVPPTLAATAHAASLTRLELQTRALTSFTPQHLVMDVVIVAKVLKRRALWGF